MAVIWGVNYSVAKFGARAFSPLAFNGLRVALAALALVAVSLVAVRDAWPTRARVLRLLALGVLGNCVYQLFFIEGLARTRAGTASLVLAASPAFIAIIGRLLGVERLTRRGAAGVALSIAGVALVIVGGVSASSAPSAPATGDSLLGNALVLGGCLCWATFTVLLKPHTDRTHGLHLSAITMVGGALPLLLVSTPALAATAWRDVPPSAWGAVAYSGIGALVVAYLIWYRGVRVIGPTRTAMYGNLQPVVALAVAWLMFGEIPTAVQAGGAAAIMAGILMTRA
jgi:drug/metabolite transporter (DMT)-like permease